MENLVLQPFSLLLLFILTPAGCGTLAPTLQEAPRDVTTRRTGILQRNLFSQRILRGQEPWDFRLQVFFHESVSPKPLWVPIPFQFFRKFAEIFATQCAPPVSLTHQDPGSGAFFDPGIRDPAWVKSQDPGWIPECCLQRLSAAWRAAFQESPAACRSGTGSPYWQVHPSHALVLMLTVSMISVVDPDPDQHHIWLPGIPHPHQIKIRIRIRIKVVAQLGRGVAKSGWNVDNPEWVIVQSW